MVKYGFETWTTCETVNEKIQSFHLHSQCVILGVNLYDARMLRWSERTKPLNLPTVTADSCHSMFDHISITIYMYKQPASQTIQLWCVVLALHWLQTGSAAKPSMVKTVATRWCTPTQFVGTIRSLWRMLQLSAGQGCVAFFACVRCVFQVFWLHRKLCVHCVACVAYDSLETECCRPISLLLVCVSFTIIGQPRNSVLIRRV